MRYDPKLHHRKSIRLPDWDYSWGWWYYVTMCTQGRECIFGIVISDEMRLNDVGEIVRDEWMKTPTIRPEVELDEYVIMPNHMHGIIIINDSSQSHAGAIHESPRREVPQSEWWQDRIHESPPRMRKIDERRQMTLSKIIGRFKMNSAKQINLIRKTPGTPVWQRGFYEHIIRNDADLTRIRTYMANNPLQWAIDEENPTNK